MPPVGDRAPQEEPASEHNLIMRHDKTTGLTSSGYALFSFTFFGDFDLRVCVIRLPVFGANISFHDLVDSKICLMIILRDKY